MYAYTLHEDRPRYFKTKPAAMKALQKDTEDYVLVDCNEEGFVFSFSFEIEGYEIEATIERIVPED